MFGYAYCNSLHCHTGSMNLLHNIVKKEVTDKSVAYQYMKKLRIFKSTLSTKVKLEIIPKSISSRSFVLA